MNSPPYDAMKRRYERYWSADRPPPLDDPLSRSRRRLLWGSVARVRRSADPLRFLDAGCGSGQLVSEAQGRGLIAAGIDLSSGALDRAREGCAGTAFYEHSVEELPWPVPVEGFDVVASFEVIEHLLEPRALLMGAHRALAPGGHLALTTPYHGLTKNLLIAAAHFEAHFDVESDHIRFFTDRALRRLLGEAGFKIEFVAHIGRRWPLWANTFVWAQRN